MKLFALIPLLFILSLNSSQAGLWDCVCDFVAGKSGGAKPLHSCIPNNVFENANKLERGNRVKVTIKNKEYEGVIQSHNMDHVEIEINQKVTKYKTENLKDITVLGKVELPAKPHLVAQQKSIEKFAAQTQKIPSALEKMKPAIKKEIEYLKTLSGKDSRESYLRELATDLELKIKQKFQTENLGYHFNLHGGLDYQYAQSGGLYINQGDVFAQHGMSTHTAENVYFFQSKNIGLYDLIDSGDMRRIIPGGRMGDTMVIFDLDHPYFKKAIAEKGITGGGEIYYDFNRAWLKKQPFNDPEFAERAVGIPEMTFLGSPFPLYRSKHYKALEVSRPSRQEENLIYLRLLEDLLLK